jgi:hypothetical protein
MDNNNINDWEDIPINDWEDVSSDTKVEENKEEPSYWNKIANSMTSSPYDYESYESIQEAKEALPKAIQSGKEMAVGAGLGAAENVTFGQLPSIVGLAAGEENRKKFIDLEQEAFEKAPISSLVGGIVAPNPIGKLSQLQKVQKGINYLKGLKEGQEALTFGQKARSVASDIGTGAAMGEAALMSYGAGHSKSDDLGGKLESGYELATDPTMAALTVGLPTVGATIGGVSKVVSNLGGRKGVKARELSKEGYDFGLKEKDLNKMTAEEITNVKLSDLDKDIKKGYESTINEAQDLLKAPMEKRDALLKTYDDKVNDYKTLLVETRNKVLQLPENDPSRNSMLRQLDEYVNRLDTIQETVKIPVTIKGTQREKAIEEFEKKRNLDRLKDEQLKNITPKSVEKIGEKEALIRASGKEDFTTKEPEIFIDPATNKKVIRKEVVGDNSEQLDKTTKLKEKLQELAQKNELKIQHLMQQDALKQSQAKSIDQANKIKLQTQQQLEKLDLERQSVQNKLSQLDELPQQESQQTNYLTDLVRTKRPGQSEIQVDPVTGNEYIMYPKKDTGEIEIAWLPKNVDKTKLVDQVIETPAVNPKTELTPSELLNLKQEMGKFSNRPGEKGEAGDIEYWLRKEIDKQLEAVDPKFSQYSEEYSNIIKPYEQLLGYNPAHKVDPTEAKDQLNRFLSLSEKLNKTDTGVGERVSLSEPIVRGEQTFKPLSEVAPKAEASLKQRTQDISDKADIARALGYQIQTASPNPKTQALAALGGEYAIKGQAAAGRMQNAIQRLSEDPSAFSRLVAHTAKISAAFAKQLGQAANTHQGRTNALFSLMQMPGFRRIMIDYDEENRQDGQ